MSRPQVTKNSRLAYRCTSKSGYLSTMRESIANALKELKIGTTSEIAEFLNISHDRVHKRLSELQSEGLIYKTEFSKRSETTGQLQAVWALTDIKVNLKWEK